MTDIIITNAAHNQLVEQEPKSSTKRSATNPLKYLEF
jgi:hypothetical protein